MTSFKPRRARQPIVRNHSGTCAATLRSWRCVIAAGLLLVSVHGLAQNSNLSAHDRYIHQQSERNSAYFRNADNYPRAGAGTWVSPSRDDSYANSQLARDKSDLVRWNLQQQRIIDAEYRARLNAAVRVQTNEEFVAEVRSKTAAGDARASVTLADIHYQGVYGLPVNKREAYAAYVRGAAADPRAALMAGAMAYTADGVPEDKPAGLKLAQRAEATGYAEAIEWLAFALPSPERVNAAMAVGKFNPALQFIQNLRQGRDGVKQDAEAAYKIAAKAAHAGNARAQVLMGQALMDGVGVTKDVQQAVQWLTKADALGDKAAAYSLAWAAYDNSPSHPRDMAAFRRWAERNHALDPDAAAAFQMAVLEFHAGNLDKSRDWYSKSAKAGNQRAMTQLAYMEVQGQGGPADPQAGLAHWRQAASGGDFVALYELGTAYKRGLFGQAVDLPQAFTLMQQSAELGMSAAQHNLAVYYYEGVGVTSNARQAAFWSQKASAADYAAAQYMLANLYQDGSGVPKDAGLALAWMRKAAANGSAAATRALAQGFSGEDENTLKRRRAEKPAAAGDPAALFVLGTSQWMGWGGPVDTVAGRRHLEAAAAKGEARAMLALSDAARAGSNGFRTDVGLANQWLQRAVQTGDAVAQRQWAQRLADGDGTAKDEVKAALLRQQVAEGADADDDDQYALALLYRDGKGLPKSPEKSAQWMLLAAEGGNADAQYWLAWYYQSGFGLARSHDKAVERMLQAARSNQQDAVKALKSGFASNLRDSLPNLR